MQIMALPMLSPYYEKNNLNVKMKRVTEWINLQIKTVPLCRRNGKTKSTQSLVEFISERCRTGRLPKSRAWVGGGGVVNYGKVFFNN